MLTIQFIEQNLHFAIGLFAALVFFAVFWLYFDAWIASAERPRKDFFKWLGFLLVAVSFVPYATIIEQTSLGNSVLGPYASTLADIIRILGYIAIIAGQVFDPLQKIPEAHGLDDFLVPEQKSAKMAEAGSQSIIGGTFGLGSGFGATVLLPIAAFSVVALYWRRATTGLERHVRPVAYAFMLLFGFELFSVARLFRGTTNPSLYDIVKPFGPLWIIAHLFLLAGAIVLGRWVWRYLTERFISQLFMTFTGVVLAVFLLTTVSFTFLILRNIQDNALQNLSTATSVLNYALDSKKASTQANAEAIAASPAIAQAITTKDHKGLMALTSSFLENKQQSSLVVTTVDGQVLLRAEDPNRWGDSISSDTLFRRATIGTSSSTIESANAVIAPVVTIRSIVPVRDSSAQIIGTVSVSTVIDNSFLDGIKRSTGLDAAVYSGNVRSATTFTAPDGVSRWVGVKETNADVQATVLKQAKIFQGQLSILNRDYLAVYAPLKDADNTVVGMIFIGEPEVAVLKTTTYLISLTFIVAATLLVASIVPAYIIAKYITLQLE